MTNYNFVPDSFHTGVTAEALRAKIEQKSTISHQRGHFDPKFQVQSPKGLSKSSMCKCNIKTACA